MTEGPTQGYRGDMVGDNEENKSDGPSKFLLLTLAITSGTCKFSFRRKDKITVSQYKENSRVIIVIPKSGREQGRNRKFRVI